MDCSILLEQSKIFDLLVQEFHFVNNHHKSHSLQFSSNAIISSFSSLSLPWFSIFTMSLSSLSEQLPETISPLYDICDVSFTFDVSTWFLNVEFVSFCSLSKIPSYSCSSSSCQVWIQFSLISMLLYSGLWSLR